MDDFDIRAVSENEAYNMKKAVVSYKENLDSVIKKINNIDYATYKKGFKGKQVDTVMIYMNKTVSEMLKMSSFILEFETAIDKVINNYILMSGSVKTSDVTTASVDGEGDLSGVKDFDGNGSVNSNIISTPINNNSVTSFDGENINTEEVIPPIVSIEPESPITSFSGEQVSNNELSNSTLSTDGVVLGSGIGIIMLLLVMIALNGLLMELIPNIWHQNMLILKTQFFIDLLLLMKMEV